MAQYLVRPHDKHIFELDPDNNCYRSYSNRHVTYSNGIRPTANDTFTYDLLVNGYGFIPITVDEIEHYEVLNDEYCEFIKWKHRSNGHGGIIGGTFEEYLIQK